MKEVELKAKTAREARQEIKELFPQGASYSGYDEDGICVLTSLVRARGDKAYVASAVRPSGKPAIRFNCKPTNTVLCKCGHSEEKHCGGPRLSRWCVGACTRCECEQYEAPVEDIRTADAVGQVVRLVHYFQQCADAKPDDRINQLMALRAKQLLDLVRKASK